MWVPYWKKYYMGQRKCARSICMNWDKQFQKSWGRQVIGGGWDLLDKHLGQRIGIRTQKELNNDWAFSLSALSLNKEQKTSGAVSYLGRPSSWGSKTCSLLLWQLMGWGFYFESWDDSGGIDSDPILFFCYFSQNQDDCGSVACSQAFIYVFHSWKEYLPTHPSSSTFQI